MLLEKKLKGLLFASEQLSPSVRTVLGEVCYVAIEITSYRSCRNFCQRNVFFEVFSRVLSHDFFDVLKFSVSLIFSSATQFLEKVDSGFAADSISFHRESYLFQQVLL
jgi:hypothetical protein